MREFIAAAKPELLEDTDVIEFEHEGTLVTFFEPKTAHLGIMMSMTARRITPSTAGQFIALMFEMMDQETETYFQNRLMDRKDSFDLAGDNGLMAVFEALVEEWSARPTKEPSDYQPPQRRTGSKSTATTRAKGSTSSTSRSRATSR